MHLGFRIYVGQRSSAWWEIVLCVIANELSSECEASEEEIVSVSDKDTTKLYPVAASALSYSSHHLWSDLHK